MAQQVFTDNYPNNNVLMVYDHNTTGYKSWDSNCSIVDPETDNHVSVSPFGSLKIAEMTRLIGGNMDFSLDTFRWTGVSGSGANLEVSNGLAYLRTNGSGNGTVRMNSNKVARFLSSTNNHFLAGVRLNETGVSNNVRRWGAIDPSNGLYFFTSGNFAGIGVRKGGGRNSCIWIKWLFPFGN